MSKAFRAPPYKIRPLYGFPYWPILSGLPTRWMRTCALFIVLENWCKNAFVYLRHLIRRRLWNSGKEPLGLIESQNENKTVFKYVLLSFISNQMLNKRETILRIKKFHNSLFYYCERPISNIYEFFHLYPALFARKPFKPQSFRGGRKGAPFEHKQNKSGW